MKRRDFIKTSALSMAGISSITLENCNNSKIQGKIVGENYSFAHDFRDNKIPIRHVKENNTIYNCIILGGGISGLASAWKLKQNQVNDILVIEKGKELGGTSISGSFGDMKFPWAAHYIETPPKEATELLPFYEDSGIILGYYDNGWPIVNSEFVVKDPEVHLHTNQKWLQSRYPFNLASKKDIKDYSRFFQKIVSYIQQINSDDKSTFTLPIHLSTADTQIRSLDELTMLEWLEKENLKSSLLIWYIDMQCRDNFAVPINEISAWLALNYFSTNYREDNITSSQPIDIISWPEGNHYLVSALKKNLKQNEIQLNAFIVNIQNKDNLVEVTFYNQIKKEFVKVKGKSAIFAIPKFLLPRLCKEANDRRKHLQEFNYAPWLTANILLKHLPGAKAEAWDNIYYQPYGNSLNWSLGYVNASFQNRKLLKRNNAPFVATFYAPLLQQSVDIERKILLENDWDYWSRRIISDLKIMHKNIEEDIEQIDIMKWGHAMIQGKKGFIWGKSRMEMKKPIKRISMAHCDVGGVPIFEQSFYTGIEAAQDVMQWIEI